MSAIESPPESSIFVPGAWVVPWGMFLRNFKPDELTDTRKVISSFRTGLYCRLCDSGIIGPAPAHVEKHAAELGMYLERQAQLAEAARLKAHREAMSERMRDRLEAVTDARSGDYTLEEVAKAHGVSVQTIKKWMRELPAGREDGLEMAS